MSQTPPEDQTQQNYQRRPRLRSACNQCNVAKLKCSGERDGCIRCRTLGSDCIYAESRVGKVQGRRKRKKIDQQSPKISASSVVASQHQETATTTASAQLSKDLTTTTSALRTNLPPWTEPWIEPWTSEMQWSGDILDLDDHLAFEYMPEESTVTSTNSSSTRNSTSSSIQITEHPESPSCAPSTSHDLPPSIPEDRAILSSQRHPDKSRINSIATPPETTTGLAEMLLTPSSQVDAAGHGLVLESPKQGFHRLNSRCVLACTQILVTLENYLLSELRALDLILSTVSKAVDDLKKLVELQKPSRCDRCIILFTVIMLQIIALLEAGSNSIDNEPDTVGDILSGPQPGFGPALCFSGFVPTSEEQRLWRSRIITREYRHVGEILSSVMVLARLGPRGSSDDSRAVDARLKCLSNIEQRLKDMTAREGSRNV